MKHLFLPGVGSPPSPLTPHNAKGDRFFPRAFALALFGVSLSACSQSMIEPLPTAQTRVANFAVQYIQPFDRQALTNFPHKPLLINDGVTAGSEFDQFRTKLQNAIAQQDIAFLEPLIPKHGVRIGVGLPFTYQELQVKDTQAMLWRVLEKALGAGCQLDTETRYQSVDPNSPVWVCPNIAEEFYRQYPPPSGDRLSYALAHVIAIGTDIELYAEPNVESKVLALLNNEVVKFDYQTWERFTDDEKVANLNSLEGWTPVSLADGRSGFLLNRYAHRPLDTRVVFGKINQSWKIIDIPRGD